MAILWITFFMSALLFSSSQYIHLNEKDKCISFGQIMEFLKVCRTVSNEQTELKSEVDQLRQENKEIRGLLKKLSKNCHVPFDCYDIYNWGRRKTGIYEIFPFVDNNNFTSVQVLCDMKSSGGGWTVIQHRNRDIPRVNFNTTWDEYKRGFGDVNGNYWLGNEVIHKLTTTFQNDLYIKMKSTNNKNFEVKYDQFSISSENDSYRLSLGTKIGNIDDAFRGYNVVNQTFSTFDHDNRHGCGAFCGSGWWFDYCTWTNLNAPFYVDHINFVWYPTIVQGKDLTESEMMIKRK